MDFKDRVAIVTGGTRGIGSEITLALIKKGCSVVANYHQNDTVAREFEKKLKVITPNYIIVKKDISIFKNAEFLIEKTIENFGKIDILVNNAGIAQDKTLLKMSKEMWDNVISTDLTGVFNCTKNVLPFMIDWKFGRILSISSIVGLMGNIGQVNYSAAKSGIIGFTKSLALEVATKGITVNALAPGFTETDLVLSLPKHIQERLIERIPMHRFAKPVEIAELATFILSDKASYITGQIISINGGLYL